MMDYPILPGAVLPSDVLSVGQHVTQGRHPDRPNAVERQVQFVDRIPVQGAHAYQQTVQVQGAVPAQQPVLVRAIQPVPQAAQYVPVSQLQTIKSKGGRCLTTKMTILLSVIVICILIGTAVGVGLYLAFGRDSGKKQYSNCVMLESGSNGDRHTFHHDDDKDKDGKKKFPGTGCDDEEEERDGDDEGRDDDDDDEDDEERNSDDDVESKRRPHGGKPCKYDKDTVEDWMPDCFHDNYDGTFTLFGDGFVVYDNDGGHSYHHNDGGPTWGWDDDDVFTWFDPSGSHAGLHLCK